ncbi:TetR family transcriptional regulator [Streptomyces olivaceus]|uniref:TetR family transcriptional regulator n=1 Tax=Streptomyces olivaceus TaxID=47716 RepID=UPI0036E0FF8E
MPRDEVRRRLLAAAAQSFAERGYEDSKLEDIAHTAGFTKGAVYSNFAGKAELFGAVLKPIALGLAVGILVDAVVVRMTLVPAILALVGERSWWLPRWLDRMLPDLDMEGAKLSAPTRPEDSGPAPGPSRQMRRDVPDNHLI